MDASYVVVFFVLEVGDVVHYLRVCVNGGSVGNQLPCLPARFGIKSSVLVFCRRLIESLLKRLMSMLVEFRFTPITHEIGQDFRNTLLI